MNDYKFTDDWFSNNILIWENTFKGCQKAPLKVLEIGSHEGRSCIWLCENTLHHPESKIDCIDIWENPNIFDNFKHNISFFKDKVNYYQGPSEILLKRALFIDNEYQVVYVDGDHSAAGALKDAILSWPLLKVGGIMIFDDFLGGEDAFQTLYAPGKGILAFMDCYKDKIHIMHMNYQLIICKLKE